MERRISEPDWKLLRRLEPVALERFCQRVLSEVVRLAAGASKGSHQTYKEVYELIEKRDGELGDAFDGIRRSTAFIQLARIRSLGLVTDEEFSGFSVETQAVVALFLEVREG